MRLRSCLWVLYAFAPQMSGYFHTYDKGEPEFLLWITFLCYLLLYAAVRLLHLKFYTACIMFNIYTGYLVTNTCQVLANMFSNSTQRLAAVHSYFNLPIVWSQFSSISLHLCALIALFTRLFELQLDESTLDCVVSTECGHFGLKYTLRRVPASRYIVAFVYYFVWELRSVGFKWEHASL